MERIYHTLWTAPLNENAKQATILSYTISFLFAKATGAYVVLHCDHEGMRMLQHIPYDEIHVDLNHLNVNIAPYFWAFGKLYATMLEPLGAIHIDGDVFLKDNKLIDFLIQDKDLIVQSEENDDWVDRKLYVWMQDVIGEENLPNKMNLRYGKTLNCGVIRFNNQDLKNQYLQTYFDTVQLLIENDGFKKRMQEAKSHGGRIAPDIIVEQQFLHELANRLNMSIGYILEGNIQEDALKKNYAHLCTENKFKQVNELENFLKAISPITWQRMISENPIYQKYLKF